MKLRDIQTHVEKLEKAIVSVESQLAHLQGRLLTIEADLLEKHKDYEVTPHIRTSSTSDPFIEPDKYGSSNKEFTWNGDFITEGTQILRNNLK